MKTLPWILIWFIVFVSLAVADEQTTPLAQTRQYHSQFQQGDMTAADAAVSLLKRAVEREPDRAELWERLARSYLMQATAIGHRSGSRQDMAAAFVSAHQAYSQALKLDPENWTALAGHGMTMVLLSRGPDSGDTLRQGINRMNKAVAQDPRSNAIRVARGFTLINMPRQVRDDAAVIDDLEYLIDAAPGGRAEDVLHLLLGDLYAEAGAMDKAGREYEWVSGASALAAEETKQRLDALSRGTVPTAEIARLRSRIGAECTMCHAK